MGADRAVLVSDEAFEGADLVTTAHALAGALGRESADLVLFGQQSADGDGACLWAAVAELLRRPGDLAGRGARRSRTGAVIGQAADRVRLRADPSAASRGRRGLGLDQRAALPLAEGDHGREVEAAGDARRRPTSAASPPRARACSPSRRRPRAASAPVIEDAATAPEAIVEFLVERRLSVKTLVFLEHHGDGAHEAVARRAREGSRARRRGRGRASRARASAGSSRTRGAFGAAAVFVADDERLAAPLPQPRVDVLASLVRDEGFDTVLFAQSVLASDIAAGLAVAARCGAELGSRRSRRPRADARRQAACARRLGLVDAGWVVAGPAGALPGGGVRPGRDRRGGRT